MNKKIKHGQPDKRDFMPLTIAVLTVSDSRSEKDDTSGGLLVERLKGEGHTLVEKCILPDDVYRVRARVANWIAEPGVQVVITTGGTGVTGRDGTPEAVAPLLDKELPGFGELFRSLSYADIATSTLNSRLLGGVANATLVFCLPGSTGACRLGWDEILHFQLDRRYRPCNLAELLPRMMER